MYQHMLYTDVKHQRFETWSSTVWN